MPSEMEELQEKYEKSEEKYKKLTKLAINAIYEYDDLKKKYQENLIQYEELKKRLTETENQLNNLQTVLEPVCESFSSLQTQLEEEEAGRAEAEKTATKVKKENVKLKRQSAAILQNLGKLDCDIVNILPSIEDDPAEGENADQDKILALETERNNLKDRVRELEKEVEKERAAGRNEESQKKYIEKLKAELLKMHQKMEDREAVVENFKRTSVLALQEFSKLQDKVDFEMTLKQEAENFAHKCFADREAMKRQSAVLMNSAAADERVMHAMMEIENLTKQMEMEKKKQEDEVHSLKESLASSGDSNKIDSLRTELEISNSEVERLHRAIQDLEEWKGKAEDDMKDLRVKLDEALRPPPPPPPPPPPSCAPPITKFTSERKQFAPTIMIPMNPLASTADAQKKGMLMDEMKQMMERIQKGDKPGRTGTSRTSKPENFVKKDTMPPAMKELNNLLAGLKKSPSQRVSTKTTGSVSSPEPSTQTPANRNSKSSKPTPPPVAPRTWRSGSSGSDSSPVLRSPRTPSTGSSQGYFGFHDKVTKVAKQSVLVVEESSENMADVHDAVLPAAGDPAAATSETTEEEEAQEKNTCM